MDVFVAGHAPREIPYVGPASERVILEHLEHGKSPRVARAVDASPRRDELEAARTLRTNFLSRAGALAILEAPSPGAISRADYRGDLQMHTEWSDGTESIAEMAAAARARGYEYIGVSDHSYGLPIAGGVSMENVERQHREIDRLQSEWDGSFHVLKGIEANIPASGGVDMRDEELRRFDLVLAAPHSRLRKADDQTERMIATVRHPGVHVLAHPRGRMFTRRGVIARWEEIFEQARRAGVAIEIDGDPYRQDLDHGLARRALEAGCLFAVDSDAHSGSQLMYAEFALAHARRAGIPAERVVNTWSLERLMEWARRKAPPG
jgi:histidinol phosphatase-like PHP family hydrolase